MKLLLYDAAGASGKTALSDILVLLIFHPETYGPQIAAILPPELRPMDLFPKTCASEEMRAELLKSSPRQLFPHAPDPESALAGLFLYFSCLAEAHELVRNSSTADAVYWHGILHRMEGDAFNAGYWFRRVGPHPVFPALQHEAAELGYAAAPAWDPFAFIKFCQASARNDGLARRVQLAEWRLLFDRCSAAARVATR